ncbi:MAG: hypothetical protein JW850_01910 [Thermoflexales bacterium]|nr:hypothetical protein [Thermoflexales bacterium]
MKTYTNWSSLLVALGLALALGGGVLLVQRIGAEAGPRQPQAALGTAFSYQGRLANGGGPVDGTCDFEFSLWDALAGGGQVGGTDAEDGVVLDDGYFSVSLDFGADAFQGQARYLAIAVRCPAGGGSYVALDPRVTLAGAPYAHSLRPGAVVSGTLAGTMLAARNVYTAGIALSGASGAASGRTPPGGAGVWGDGGDLPGVFGTSGSSAGVYGWSSVAGVMGMGENNYGVAGSSANGIGVYGTAPFTGVVGVATTRYGLGVYGQADDRGAGVAGVSETGSGVMGVSGEVYGVWGTSDDGIGVWGETYSSDESAMGIVGFARSETISPTYGVFGRTNSSSSESAGVYGKGDHGFGVHGETDSAIGNVSGVRGVSKYGDTLGVWGETASDSSSSAGVYAYASSATGASRRTAKARSPAAVGWPLRRDAGRDDSQTLRV